MAVKKEITDDIGESAKLAAAELAAEALLKKQEEDEAAEKKAPRKKSKLIKVRPTKGYMWEPFQLIAIQEGVETPVEETSWVTSQIEAGLLEKC